jgi:hypothetical protein
MFAQNWILIRRGRTCNYHMQAKVNASKNCDSRKGIFFKFMPEEDQILVISLSRYCLEVFMKVLEQTSH